MKKFNENEMFCAACLMHETFFSGDGSWSPDCCPTCGCIDVIFYKEMTAQQKYMAEKKFNEIWKKYRIHSSDTNKKQ